MKNVDKHLTFDIYRICKYKRSLGSLQIFVPYNASMFTLNNMFCTYVDHVSRVIQPGLISFILSLRHSETFPGFLAISYESRLANNAEYWCFSIFIIKDLPSMK